MTNALASGPVRETFAASGLDSLIAASARDCQDLVLLRDDVGVSTAGQVARRVSRLAALFRHAGFLPGERVLIVAGAMAASVVVLAAALRAGLEPALMPVGIEAVDIATYARIAKAVALIGPSHYGAIELGDAYLSAAAAVDTIRMIATQGPAPVDGAVDVSFERLDAMVDITDPDTVPSHDELPMIATFEGPASMPMLVSHRQPVLLADALMLVEQARIVPSGRIISTIAPASLAGIVAGPCAALIGASELALHGPFDARQFLALCDRQPPYHLVAPAAIGALFEDGALTVDMISLICLSRVASATAFELPPAVDCDRLMVDLYAFGEETVLSQRRTEGQAQAPARVADMREGSALGAQLNRARAEQRIYTAKGA